MSITHRINDSVSSDSGSVGISGYDNETGTSEIVIDTSFAASSSNATLTLAFTAANLQSVFLVCDKGCVIKTNATAVADVQTVTITGTPTGGTFGLDFNGQPTTALAYNATASDVQTALRALSTIGGSNVTCTGGPLPGTAVVCTFAGTLATGKQPVMTTANALTGGTTPAVSVAHTTSGKPSDTITLVAGVPYVWRRSAGYNTCLFTTDVTSAFVSCTPAVRLQGKFLTS